MDSRDQLSAERLRAARTLLNWSRVQLAAKANLSESTICERDPLKGTPSLARSEGQNSSRHADNRNWRRRAR
ncbi:MAG: helix-turn-helix transcriptional regulator [Mesorhizobium sp.]|nr:MAG: helix-turn-helix transcriptional regulator [Mesorhizobium sp.]TIO62037.1 MAG: helix-turn-helix transcriptional regulator [Mesorhizobium sp.]TJV59168.1 MAG: helix-turn-helix transcriptional regulator [Mesorhizobium sp.]